MSDLKILPEAVDEALEEAAEVVCSGLELLDCVESIENDDRGHIIVDTETQRFHLSVSLEDPLSPAIAKLPAVDIATIRAALTYWAREGIMSNGSELDMATGYGSFEPLGADAIRNLVARISAQRAAEAHL